MAFQLDLLWSTDGGVWGLWRVSPFAHAHTSASDKLSVHGRLRGLLIGLPAESMLLSVCERLDAKRGEKTRFFVFANTVAASSYTRQDDPHGWLGIRFQTSPRKAPSQIIIHVRLLDKENVQEQEALGVLGVNLAHGACYLHAQPEITSAFHGRVARRCGA